MKFMPVLLTLSLAACSVGPNYHRPTAPVTPRFKELEGWKPAEPFAETPKGAWWSVFDDPVLDGLERQVAVTNQNVKQAEAAYRQAVALVRESQAAWFPTLGVTTGVTRKAASAPSTSATLNRSATGTTVTQYNVGANASWDLDVWGRIRRQVESQQAAAQVSAADLANAQLSAQSTLAGDYFDLRGADSLIGLLTETVDAYRRALQITRNQYAAGTASRGDVVTAEAQLKTVQAQLVGAGVQRAQYEHAIAVLAGHSPAELTLPTGVLATHVPVVPVGLPSALLERRPDIAAAERTLAEQNAQIGVATAAFYPDISLSAAIGFTGNPLSSLIETANRTWSLGATASETLLDGGERGAAVMAARAGYDQAVATYRQTVLNAFQQVEDELSSLRILEQQATAEQEAVEAARRAVDVILNQYRAGTVAYTSVITEQTQLLSNEQSAVSIQQSRLVASVALIEAVGGGWQATDLPGKRPVNPATVLVP
jgi:NodT family efflux transporter outer membrane factor (OMF) lipoprotein